ncbi:uncharacterized protein LOC117220541 isoform X1 [Megalopta genalis]|uniref:uncharacterized protein LOC117220541 isoform X1 n=1 Tax=Megalopta genalis TaxID=115081 RepID=UPI003FD5C566
MQFYIILLLLISCQQSTLAGIYIKDHNNLRPVQGDNFFRGIGDWFGHLKDRLYEKFFGQQTTIESTEESALPDDILDLDEFQLRRKLRNRKWLRVDLSTLIFDPNRDWGFRVGNWYFIRKDSKNVNQKDNSNESDLQGVMRPTESVEVRTERTLDDTNPATVDSLSIPSSTVTLATDIVTQLMTQQTNPYIPTESSTQIDAFENLSSRIEKQTEDYGANDYLQRKGSVEVLMG